MSAAARAICRLLAARNGGPGLTADELAAEIGAKRAFVRQELAELVFREATVTCDREGRYRMGDPTALMELA